LCPIHKKGDQVQCKNYGGVTLLNTAYKLFSNVMYARLLPYAEKDVGNYRGFFPGRSTRDQIYMARQILGKTLEYNNKTHHLFIDFQAAYDTVNRKQLIKAMQELGIPQKYIIRLVGMTLKGTRAQVKIERDLSEEFHIRKGLRQGDSLSCLLFNLALEKVIKDSKLNTRGTIFLKSTQVLAYANDIDLIGRTKKCIAESCKQF
jgi:sorting nexin-29